MGWDRCGNFFDTIGSPRAKTLQFKFTPNNFNSCNPFLACHTMKLGFVTAILPELSLDEVIKTARDLDYDCIEVMCWPPSRAERRYAGVTHIDVSELDSGSAKSVRAKLDEYDIQISGLGYYPNPLDPDTESSQVYIDHIRKVIDAAKLLDIPVVNTFVGRDWKKTVDENWPRFLDVWNPIIGYAASVDIRIAIENCPMAFTDDEWPGGKNLATTPKTWTRMFSDIPSNHFGLNYDPSHMIWQHMDYLAPIRDFTSKLFHIHAKDVRLEKHKLDQVGIMANPSEYHSPKLPGLGDVDWGNFFSELYGVGYQGPVCVEVEDRAFEESLELRIAALQQSVTFLRQFIPKMRSV